MEQYYRLFSSVRIPGITKDKLVESNTKLALEPEHVIVIYRNRIYALDVIVNFTRLSNDDLYHQLRRIKRHADEDEETCGRQDQNDVTFLTTLPRDQWAQARLELLKGKRTRFSEISVCLIKKKNRRLYLLEQHIQDSTNRDSLDIVERGIFVICLDKHLNETIKKSDSQDKNSKEIKSNFTNRNQIFEYKDESDEDFYNGDHTDSSYSVALAFKMLHGSGSRFSTGNRWFDKTIQVKSLINCFPA
jgi:hypothetical protein